MVMKKKKVLSIKKFTLMKLNNLASINGGINSEVDNGETILKPKGTRSPTQVPKG